MAVARPFLVPNHVTQLRIALAACVDRATVYRYFRGEKMRLTTQMRIEQQLDKRKLGLRPDPARVDPGTKESA